MNNLALVLNEMYESYETVFKSFKNFKETFIATIGQIEKDNLSNCYELVDFEKDKLLFDLPKIILNKSNDYKKLNKSFDFEFLNETGYICYFENSTFMLEKYKFDCVKDLLFRIILEK